MLVSADILQDVEERQAARRALNRQMIAAAQGPVCRARRAYAQAAAAQRSTLVLQPLPEDYYSAPLEPLHGAAREQKKHAGTLAAEHRRVLDLITQGASRREAVQVLGCTFGQVDGLLRHAYAILGAHSAHEAGVAWRARAEESGHTPDQGDLAALAALRPQSLKSLNPAPRERAALTPRMEECLRLCAQGVRRRDLPEHMGISPSTVHGVLGSAFKRLNVHTLPEALARLGA